MKSKKPLGSFTPHEIRRFILPITLMTIAILTGLIIDSLLNDPAPDPYLIGYALVAIVYVLLHSSFITRTADFQEAYGILNAVIVAVGLGLLPFILPARLSEVPHILVVLGIIAIATTTGRYHAYLALLGILILNLSIMFTGLDSPGKALEFMAPFIVTVVVAEAVLRLKDTTQQHIHRLETINKVSRQIMLSLETEQTISLLNATIQDALEADTYFVGIVKENEIHLDLFYDDGEYYSGVRLPIEGTLSGWVVKNQRDLFLPDLRQDVELEGVGNFIIGKEKTSLSWMGVPLKAVNITGVIALGSYQPNAFDQADMELLSNLAQHITLALDNTIRHAQVEEQARLDSLTGVYNHGYFLKKLEEQTEEVLLTDVPLSLIMLDVDFFKQYNDTYGHLVGDRILKTLCTAIKHYIKQADTVGRWGGEEFVISLPGANGAQATQIAQRIGQRMAALRVEDRAQRMIPVPTVSQGIAVFPLEEGDIYRLIDLADSRLYIAKERGRNQIEPDISHWAKLQ